MSKYKVGDRLIVTKYHNADGDEGSIPRNNFIVRELVVGNKSMNIYFPDDNKQGAYEDQLQFESWKSRLGA